MTNIPHDFVALVHDWPKAMRFEKLAPDVWIKRTWDGKWVYPREWGDAAVTKIYEMADYVFLPESVATETDSM